MPDDVVWKRDIYRQLDLLEDKNAPMYYPVEPQGRQVNLFTYLFRLVLTGRVPAYKYKLDGNESFEEKDKLEVRVKTTSNENKQKNNLGIRVKTSSNKNNQKDNLGIRVKTTSNENKQNGLEEFTDFIGHMFQTVFGVRV